jgi:hypothetical protein
MRSSQVVRGSGCQCQSRNSLGFDPSIPTLVYILKNFIYPRNFTNKVRVCRVTLSRQRPALPDPKQDPDPESDPDWMSEPKQIIPDPSTTQNLFKDLLVNSTYRNTHIFCAITFSHLQGTLRHRKVFTREVIFY